MSKSLRNLSVFRTKCPICDNEFEYQYSEVTVAPQFHTEFIMCPQCKNLLYHSNSVKSKNIDTLSL